MTDKKIEALFHDAIIVSEQLERNLQQFDKNSKHVNKVYKDLDHIVHTIEHLTLINGESKKVEAKKFAQTIKDQIDRYHTALQEVNLDTTEVESLIERYNDTILTQTSKLEESAITIAETLEKNGEAIISAAQTFKKGQKSFAWSFTLFFSGVVIGGMFLAVYPITTISKTFYQELKIRDEKLNKLKEQYETNSKMITFLKANDITVKTRTTNDSWTKRSFRFSPMLLLDQKRVSRVDEINGYTRIIFKKTKERI